MSPLRHAGAQIAAKLFELIETETYCKMRDHDLTDVLIDGQVDLTRIADQLMAYLGSLGYKASLQEQGKRLP